MFWKQALTKAWTEYMSNVAVLRIIRAARTFILTMRKRYRKLLGHIMRKDGL